AGGLRTASLERATGPGTGVGRTGRGGVVGGRRCVEPDLSFQVRCGSPAGGGAGDCRGAILPDRASSRYRAWYTGARDRVSRGDSGVTELLYLHDSYMREFDATVELQGDQAVALDRTAFFIGGGGQPRHCGRPPHSRTFCFAGGI